MELGDDLLHIVNAHNFYQNPNLQHPPSTEAIPLGSGPLSDAHVQALMTAVMWRLRTSVSLNKLLCFWFSKNQPVSESFLLINPNYKFPGVLTRQDQEIALEEFQNLEDNVVHTLREEKRDTEWNKELQQVEEFKDQQQKKRIDILETSVKRGQALYIEGVEVVSKMVDEYQIMKEAWIEEAKTSIQYDNDLPDMTDLETLLETINKDYEAFGLDGSPIVVPELPEPPKVVGFKRTRNDIAIEEEDAEIQIIQAKVFERPPVKDNAPQASQAKKTSTKKASSREVVLDEKAMRHVQKLVKIGDHDNKNTDAAKILVLVVQHLSDQKLMQQVLSVLKGKKKSTVSSDDETETEKTATEKSPQRKRTRTE